MLEIYKSHINTMNGRPVTDLQKVDQIAPECWIALTAPTEDELKIVEEALIYPLISYVIHWMKKRYHVWTMKLITNKY